MTYFISAPFGNYLRFKQATSVTGTWTVSPRPGRLIQIIRTLRYVRTPYGWSWRNKLGLRNPGLREGMWRTDYQSVLSVAAVEPLDCEKIQLSISQERNIELNVSCPNLDAHDDTTTWSGFDKFPERMHGRWCIVKIPPTATTELIDRLADQGYTQIHASNTLPSPKGGISGKSLVPHTLRIIDYVKSTHPHIEVIAGGGITTPQDRDCYLDAGADHISLGSVSFTPWRIPKIIGGRDAIQNRSTPV